MPRHFSIIPPLLQSPDGVLSGHLLKACDPVCSRMGPGRSRGRGWEPQWQGGQLEPLPPDTVHHQSSERHPRHPQGTAASLQQVRSGWAESPDFRCSFRPSQNAQGAWQLLFPLLWRVGAVMAHRSAYPFPASRPPVVFRSSPGRTPFHFQASSPVLQITQVMRSGKLLAAKKYRPAMSHLHGCRSQRWDFGISRPTSHISADASSHPLNYASETSQVMEIRQKFGEPGVRMGMAWVQMATPHQAEAALNSPDAVLGNRFIRLEWAQRDVTSNYTQNNPGDHPHQPSGQHPNGSSTFDGQVRAPPTPFAHIPPFAAFRSSCMAACSVPPPPLTLLCFGFCVSHQTSVTTPSLHCSSYHALPVHFITQMVWTICPPPSPCGRAAVGNGGWKSVVVPHC